VFSYLSNYRHTNTAASVLPVRLKGLNPEKKYSIKEINLYPGTRSALAADLVLSGEYLMTVGFNPDVSTRRTSVIVTVEEIK
jgi:alpha-galactosidase